MLHSGRSRLLCSGKERTFLLKDPPLGKCLSANPQLWPESNQKDRRLRLPLDLCLHPYQTEFRYSSAKGLFLFYFAKIACSSRASISVQCLVISLSSQRWQISVHTYTISRETGSQLVWMAHHQDHPRFWKVLLVRVKAERPLSHQKCQERFLCPFWRRQGVSGTGVALQGCWEGSVVPTYGVI